MNLQELLYTCGISGHTAVTVARWCMFQAAIRSRRSVDDVLRTVDGVPIVDGPYGNRPLTASQGLSLYETLQSQRQTQPTVPSANTPTDNPSIQPHHRSVGPQSSPTKGQ